MHVWGHFEGLHAATHEPLEHTDVEPEQPLHATPPSPHALAEAVVTHVVPLQQPLQFDDEHVGPPELLDPPELLPPPELLEPPELELPELVASSEPSSSSSPASPGSASSSMGASSPASFATASPESSPPGSPDPLLPPLEPSLRGVTLDASCPDVDASPGPSPKPPRPVMVPQAATTNGSTATGTISARILQR
jgi:hypothetical protein